MKRHIYLLLLLFFVNLGASAQIQRHFFDFELGVTSMSKVFNYFKNQGNDVYQPHNDELAVTKVRFGGYLWDFALFHFFNDKLYDVCFAEDDTHSSEVVMESKWEDLSKKLYNKYFEHYDSSASKENSKFFIDTYTSLVINYKKDKAPKALMIVYCDKKLHEAKSKSEEDEL